MRWSLGLVACGLAGACSHAASSASQDAGPDAGPVANWGEPSAVAGAVNVDGGWTDMPVVDPRGEGLWFVYGNGKNDLTPAVCSRVGPDRVGNQGNNFDLYLAPSDGGAPVAAGWSTGPDVGCLGAAWNDGCVCGAPQSPTVDCSQYEGCRYGNETAAAPAFHERAVVMARDELSWDPQASCLRSTTRLYLVRATAGGWGPPLRLPATVNAPGFRVDTPTLSPDGRRLCFSRASLSDFAEQSDRAFELWCSDRLDVADDQGWWAPWRSTLNQEAIDGFDYQPMFTADGRLLFTTNRGLMAMSVEIGGQSVTLPGLTIHLAVPQGGDFVDTGIFPALRFFDAGGAAPVAARYHLEGGGSLSADGRTFFFNRVTDPAGVDGCGLGLRVFSATAL